MIMDNHMHRLGEKNFFHSGDMVAQFFLVLPFVLALIIYIYTAVVASRRYKQWPLYRTTFWILGVFCALATVIGPLAERAHFDFTIHMLGHLLLGMLAPLLMVLAAPMTLILRTLDVRPARRLSQLLRSKPVSILSSPIVASLLNIGGLWLLYTTDLYMEMQQSMVLHVLVHLHVFLAGYLFTASIIYIDPTPHRFSFIHRAIVFMIALSGHGILSKYIYTHPPVGVPVDQAEIGGMLMYYGGDAIDLVLIFILCSQWYRATRPRKTLSISQ